MKRISHILEFTGDKTPEQKAATWLPTALPRVDVIRIYVLRDRRRQAPVQKADGRRPKWSVRHPFGRHSREQSALVAGLVHCNRAGLVRGGAAKFLHCKPAICREDAQPPQLNPQRDAAAGTRRNALKHSNHFASLQVPDLRAGDTQHKLSCSTSSAGAGAPGLPAM